MEKCSHVNIMTKQQASTSAGLHGLDLHVHGNIGQRLGTLFDNHFCFNSLIKFEFSKF